MVIIKHNTFSAIYDKVCASHSVLNESQIGLPFGIELMNKVGAKDGNNGRNKIVVLPINHFVAANKSVVQFRVDKN